MGFGGQIDRKGIREIRMMWQNYVEFGEWDMATD